MVIKSQRSKKSKIYIYFFALSTTISSTQSTFYCDQHSEWESESERWKGKREYKNYKK